MNSAIFLRRFFQPFAKPADLFPNHPALLSFRRISQSQRDCILQPRVARNELPWVNRHQAVNPERVPPASPHTHFERTPEATRGTRQGFAVTATFLALILLFTACNRHSQQQHAPPPPSVTVAPVEQKEIVEWDEFTGRIEPVEAVEVRPRVSGYIQEIKFQSGQMVKKGDV